MMRTERGAGSEKKEAVSKDLEKRLEGYALAAAAGLGVLALAMPAEATIIGSSENIVVNGSHPNESLAIPGGPTLHFGFLTSMGGQPKQLVGEYIHVTGPAGAHILQHSGSPFGAFPLSAGAQLRANEVQIGLRWSPSSAGATVAGKTLTDMFGYFRTIVNGHPGFLGFKSGSRVGWAAVDITGSFSANNLTAHITDYAFDTVPGQSIIVGAARASEPSTPTLVLLALGALGLGELRRRKRSAASRQQPAA
jgi:hypothetical protein